MGKGSVMMGWLEKRRTLREMRDALEKMDAEWDVAKKEMMAAFDSGDRERIEKAMAEDKRIRDKVIEQKMAIARLKGLLPG
jgi:hypothetical protein